jgi:hypothetical protein
MYTSGNIHTSNYNYVQLAQYPTSTKDTAVIHTLVLLVSKKVFLELLCSND